MLDLDTFLTNLHAEFPELVDPVARAVTAEFFAPDAFCIRVEGLAALSNRLMQDGERDTLRRLFRFMAESRLDGSPAVRDLIDVEYVEGLFLNTPLHARVLGWEVLPDSLRAEYLRYWRWVPVPSGASPLGHSG